MGSRVLTFLFVYQPKKSFLRICSKLNFLIEFLAKILRKNLGFSENQKTDTETEILLCVQCTLCCAVLCILPNRLYQK